MGVVGATEKLEGMEGTLLVDEPDSHLHPDLQQRYAKFLVELNKEYCCSIIVATHGTTLLSSLGYYGGVKTSVIYFNERNERFYGNLGFIYFIYYRQDIQTDSGR